MVFVDLFTEGGSTAAVVTPDTAVNESSKKMADSVTRFPGRLCSRDGKLCCYGRLEYDFIDFRLASYFSYILLPYSGTCVSPLRDASSMQQSSATLQQVERVLVSFVSFVSCLMSEFLLFFVVFFVFIVLVSWLAWLLWSRTRYVST